MLKKSKQISSFLQECKKIEERQKKDNALKPCTMELLSIYDKNHKELGHSNVIAYLLNTTSVRTNKKEYLYLFLELLNLPNIDLNNIDLSTTEIYREKYNIDIYIKHDEFAIIIENKVYASDQEHQLQNYKNIVKSKSSIPLERIYIIYLTLDGKEASEYSTNNDEELNELKDKGQFINCSYKNEIIEWLQHIPIKNIEHELRSAIEQYLYTLKILTHQTQSEITMKDNSIDILKDSNFDVNTLDSIAFVCTAYSVLKKNADSLL